MLIPPCMDTAVPDISAVILQIDSSRTCAPWVVISCRNTGSFQTRWSVYASFQEFKHDTQASHGNWEGLRLYKRSRRRDGNSWVPPSDCSLLSYCLKGALCNFPFLLKHFLTKGIAFKAQQCIKTSSKTLENIWKLALTLNPVHVRINCSPANSEQGQLIGEWMDWWKYPRLGCLDVVKCLLGWRI